MLCKSRHLRILMASIAVVLAVTAVLLLGRRIGQHQLESALAELESMRTATSCCR